MKLTNGNETFNVDLDSVDHAARFWWGCVIVGSATMLDGLVLASAGAGLGVAGALVTCAGMLIIQQRERKNP